MEQLWCGGVPQSGQRTLEPEELQRARSARAGAFGAAALAIGAAIGWLAAGIAFESELAVGTGVVVGLPLSILLTRDWLRAAFALGDDVHRGEALQFGDVEVLPRSHRVVSRSGTGADLRRTAFVAVAAAPDANAPVTPWYHDGAPAQRRDLSDMERQELRDYLRVRRRPGLSEAAVLVVVSFGLFMQIPVYMHRTGGFGVPLVMCLGLLTGAILIVLRRIRMSRLRGDADAGYVIRTGTAEERLPRTGRPWSGAGRPAQWRLRRAR